ncbi:MAG: MiaB/RimO family radical SAM methylthiotransferase [Acidobacteria bacterium]|nr:MAG: MiaB/RimO family radical SAM methylthiotransferase [Acidobacteriota bacterium]
MKFAVLTFGCRTNEADSCRLERDLAASGGTGARAEAADLVVVNTCTVTAAADQAARQAIRRIARVNPTARIVATGCYATRRPGELEALPGVVALVPNARKSTIAAIRDGHLAGSQPPIGVAAPGMRGRTTYPLRVQTGCDQACSYCIVPSTRGPGRSVGMEEVRDEARRLSAAGFLEVVLTGVHLGAWGRDLSPSRTLADLLLALDSVPGTVRFRLSSLEPMDCSPAVIEIVAGSPRFQPHFHLPLQHASERMLCAMRRPYTFAAYRRLAERVRERVPNAAIGSDVVVGFPGERDEDMAELEEYLPASPITHLHVFPYSARPGTAAAAMEPKVPGATIRARAERLRAAGRALTSRFEASHVGHVLDGLTLRDGTMVLTDNFLKISVPPGRRRNERVRVKVESAAPLQGEVLP